MDNITIEKLEELKSEYKKWMNYMNENFNANMEMPSDNVLIYWALNDLLKSFIDLNQRNTLD